MRILIDMGHPGHVHLFKNFIREMERRGHEVKITARDKEITLQLLCKYGFNFVQTGSGKVGNTNLIWEWISRDIEVFKISREFCPDILLGVGNPSVAHTSTMLRKPSVIFTDTEHAKFGNKVTFPFASAICTPSCYRDDIGPKQVRYNGYHELAYLHPKYFTPNPAVLTELGLAEGDPFIIVRFVSWRASHDVGQHGICDKIGLVKALEQYGRVLITSEGALPEELRSYQIRVSPEKLHDLLYYATLYVGEGGTTASEAAVLGAPSIYVSSLVGTMGNFIELEESYGLLYSFTDGNAALGRAIEILQDPESKEKWKTKRELLLADKINVTAFMIWFVENYPRSLTEVKEYPEVQYSCAPVPGDAL
jgi:predicted glycosyltransferase